ncbi:hypothetical protein [Streptomyces sp. WM6378]|nr:hypothetical protein [Streptomyces sp. WM6378]
MRFWRQRAGHLTMFPKSRWAQYTLTQLNAIESNLDLRDQYE